MTVLLKSWQHYIPYSKLNFETFLITKHSGRNVLARDRNNYLQVWIERQRVFCKKRSHLSNFDARSLRLASSLHYDYVMGLESYNQEELPVFRRQSQHSKRKDMYCFGGPLADVAARIIILCLHARREAWRWRVERNLIWVAYWYWQASSVVALQREKPTSRNNDRDERRRVRRYDVDTTYSFVYGSLRLFW